MFKTLIYQTLRPVVTASLCSYNSYKNSLIQFWMKCCLYQTTGWARLKACFGPFINKWQATHLSKYSYGPLQTQITHTHKSHTNIITLLSVGEPCAQYLAQKTTGHRPQSQATVTVTQLTTCVLRHESWGMMSYWITTITFSSPLLQALCCTLWSHAVQHSTVFFTVYVAKSISTYDGAMNPLVKEDRVQKT